MHGLKSTQWLAVRQGGAHSGGEFSRALGRIGSDLSLLSNDEVDVMDRICAGGRISIYASAATWTRDQSSPADT
jgi:hypothetical protein